MSLPVLATDTGLLIPNPDTGELQPLHQATDRTLAQAADELGRLDRELLEAKRAIARELRERYGVGRVHAGGYGFTVTESQSWPLKATSDVLDGLAREGRISEADVIRCMPERPKPDGRQLKALIGRLTVSDPEAARAVAEACSVSPPSVRDVVLESVEEA